MRKLCMAALMLFMCIWPCCCNGETITVSPVGLSLTEALAQAEWGDVIEVEEGHYTSDRESFPLVVDKSITIRAADGAEAVIEGPAMVSTFRVEAENVHMEGLSILFRRHGLYVIGNGLTLEDCTFTLIDTDKWRTSSCGIWFGGVKNVHMTNVHFTECSPCFAGPPISEKSVGLPVLTGMFEVGEDEAYFTTHRIEECTVNGKPLFYQTGGEEIVAPEDAGAVIIACCDRAVVHGVDASHASMGIELVACKQVEVKDCRADDCGIFGIYAAKAESGCIQDCTVARTNHGIDIRASRNIMTTGCRAVDCDQGIFYSMVQHGVVESCTVQGTGQGYFFAVGEDNLLVDCRAIDCENGFNLEHEEGILISDCYFAQNTVCSVRLNGSDTIMTGCTFAENWVDVMAYAGAGLVMSDCTLQNSGACGLMLRDVIYSRITGNEIHSLGTAIEAKGELSGTVLAHNTLSGAVQLAKGSSLAEINNTYIP